MSGPRGRRPGDSRTRDAIAEAARRQFAELGYPGTTLRGIAKEAGVDTRLVTHYFGSKQALFVSVLELPFDPDSTVVVLMDGDRDEVGIRVAHFITGVLSTPSARSTITGMLRAAASEDAAAAMLRDVLISRILTPLARAIGGDQPELRASLMGSQIAGLSFARFVVGLPTLADVEDRVLVAALAPVFQHYLTDPLPGPARTPAATLSGGSATDAADHAS